MIIHLTNSKFAPVSHRYHFTRGYVPVAKKPQFIALPTGPATKLGIPFNRDFTVNQGFYDEHTILYGSGSVIGWDELKPIADVVGRGRPKPRKVIVEGNKGYMWPIGSKVPIDSAEKALKYKYGDDYIYRFKGDRKSLMIEI